MMDHQRHLFYVAAAAACGVYYMYRRQRRKRQYGVQDAYKLRKINGDYHNLVPHLRDHEPELHFDHFRMDKERFDYLLELVTPFLEKSSFREPLPPGEKLAITLSYLSSGMSMTTLTSKYLVAKATISKLLPEVCDAIWRALQENYLPQPNEAIWRKIAQDYYDLCNLPNCTGAIDGKLIRVVRPQRIGNKVCSLVLLVVCDAHKCFTAIDVGCHNNDFEGGILASSTFGMRMKANELGLPVAKEIPGTKTSFPYYFVGDEAFPLMTSLLRPYPNQSLSEKQIVYNYRLSRGRISIDNALGILCARWQIFTNPINAKPDKVESFVRATCALHNFIMKEDMNIPPEKRRYCPPRFADSEDSTGSPQWGEWRQLTYGGLPLVGRFGSNCHTRRAAEIRDFLADYFVSPEGSLQDQVYHANRGYAPN